jgi:hypothetical protein
MPITNVGLPIPVVGPGLQMIVRSSLIGPFPIDWRWRVRIGRRGDEVNGGVFITAPLDQVDQFERRIQVDSITDTTVVTQRSNQYALSTNEPVDINIELTDSTGLVVQDSGTISTAVWDSQASTALLVQPAVAGSFTAQDRATLEENNQLSLAIQDATQVALPGLPVNTTLPLSNFFAVSPLDRLTTESLSGGITCDPVRVDISSSNFTGVQVRITDFPPDWRFGTPDSSWGFHDLAVLTMVRGGVTLKRVGIHTLSFTEQPLPGQLLPWAVGFLGVAIIPRDYQLHVDWADGVCGELVGLLLP